MLILNLMNRNICICNYIVKTIDKSLLNNIFFEINEIDSSINNYEKLVNCSKFNNIKKKYYDENKISIFVNKIPLYNNNKCKIIWNKINNNITINL